VNPTHPQGTGLGVGLLEDFLLLGKKKKIEEPHPRKVNRPKVKTSWNLIKVGHSRSDPRLFHKQDKEAQTIIETSDAEVQTNPVVIFPLPPPDISPAFSPDLNIDVTKPPLTPGTKRRLKRAKKRIEHLFK